MTPMCPLFRGLTVLHSLLTHTHTHTHTLTHTHTQQAAAEGSGDEEEMEGIDTGESIMSHISVPSQQEVYNIAQRSLARNHINVYHLWFNTSFVWGEGLKF